MSKQIKKTHLFSEVDLDLTKKAHEVWKDLFDVCEQIGFMPSKEKYGFSVVGPFNIPDSLDLEIQFQATQKEANGSYYIKEIRAVLRDNATRELKQGWNLYEDFHELEEYKRPML